MASPIRNENYSTSTAESGSVLSSASADTEQQAPTEQQTPYPLPANLPTQLAPEGIRFDFNQGARVVLPQSDRRANGASGCATSTPATSCSRARTRAPSSAPPSASLCASASRCGTWIKLDQCDNRHPGADPRYDARDREVLIQFPIGTLGDILAWFPYAARFAEVHGCQLTCAMSGLIIPLLRDAYPTIRFVTHEELVEQRPDRQRLRHLLPRPVLRRQRTASSSRPISAMSGCIAPPAISWASIRPRKRRAWRCRTRAARSPNPMSASPCRARRRARYWNNPNGWREVVAFLKAQRLPGDLHRPEAGARHWPRLEPYSRTARRTRPATGRWPSARAGCAMPTSSSASAAACPGWPGRPARRW